MANPLQSLFGHGQSLWLDFIRRSLMQSGELATLISEDGLRGMTSNPTIFQKAIAGSDDYDEAILSLLDQFPQASVTDLYERLAIGDVQRALDIFFPLYQESQGTDGFVSLEVSPQLANDSQGTIAEAKRLWQMVERPNLMIKVPATMAGIPAIEALLAEGINVNVTLMFSLAHYEAVAQAYLRGLARCVRKEYVASVASFFVSRVDTVVDALLDKIGSPAAKALRGKAAIANCKAVYARFREIFYGESFQTLRTQGAKVQRVLWASTSTKNPAYSDVLYIEELIGSDTVNTIPPETIKAFREHGVVRPTLAERLAEAKAFLTTLASLGIDMQAITEQLQKDGVAAFIKSFTELMTSIAQKRHTMLAARLNRCQAQLGAHAAKVEERLRTWENSKWLERLWAKDHTLWSLKPVAEISDRLGWLTLPEMTGDLKAVRTLAEEAQKENIRHVVVLGMGGASLTAEVWRQMFAPMPGYPSLVVLDTTHPAAILALQRELDLRHTWFIVASKSGTTRESFVLFHYFWHTLRSAGCSPSRHFIAITDPDTPLTHMAQARGFRRIFSAFPEMSGRYSALSVFGLVPAALLGLDTSELLRQARIMQAACGMGYTGNPALLLGAVLAELALAGRDKLTLMTSPGLCAFSLWLEQLIAESSGKDGKGVVPVSDEPAAAPETYGNDRIFVAILLQGDTYTQLEKKLTLLAEAGHPVVRIELPHKKAITQEMYRWQLATASLCSALGVHPFDQPDVDLGKKTASKATEHGGKTSRYGNGINVVSVQDSESLGKAIKNWLALALPGTFLAIQAYLAPCAANDRILHELVVQLQACTHVAVTAAYGPRYLHSTGQMHKGGLAGGLFLQLTDDSLHILPIPEEKHSFNSLIAEQSLGDYQALRQYNRIVLRIELGSEVEAGLQRICHIIAGYKE